MATAKDSTTNEEPPAAIYYPEKRKKQIIQRLKQELEVLKQKTPRKNDFPEEKTLESITLEIGVLDKEVKAHAFEGGHFTKQYRTFQGLCDKLLQHLSNLDHGNDVERKKKLHGAIKEIQEIIGYINSKVHADGKCCSKCELYGTM